MSLHWIEGRIESCTTMDARFFFKRPGWEYHVTLQPWRIEGGAIAASKLRAIVHNLDRASADSLIDTYQTGQIVRIAVAELPAPTDERLQVSILTVAGVIEDTALAAFVVPAPVFAPYEHPALGRFVKEKDYLSYTGEAAWNGKPITLLLDGDYAELGACAATAETMLAAAALWQAEMTARAYTKMHANWDAVWREGDPALSEAEWTARLTIEALSVTADGHFTASFDDGDLFWGHTVEVLGSLAQGATDAAMLG